MEEDLYSLTLAQVGHNVDKVKVRQNTIHPLCTIQVQMHAILMIFTDRWSSNTIIMVRLLIIFTDVSLKFMAMTCDIYIYANSILTCNDIHMMQMVRKYFKVNDGLNGSRTPR